MSNAGTTQHLIHIPSRSKNELLRAKNAASRENEPSSACPLARLTRHGVRRVNVAAKAVIGFRTGDAQELAG